MEGMKVIQKITDARLHEIEAAAMLDGQLQVIPSSVYAGMSANERAFFCHAKGLYLLPTTELIERLKIEIGDHLNETIEIAAGSGALGRALGIRMTDSYLQKLNSKAAQLYQQLGQPVVQYGEDVLIFEALEAVKRFRPHTVVVAWGTHKYSASAHNKGGNQWGIRFDKIMAMDCVQKIILVGNDKVHEHNPLMQLPHRAITGDFLYSRSFNGTDKIFIWEKDNAK